MNRLNPTRRNLHAWALAFALLFFASHVCASDALLELDPAQSKVSYTLTGNIHTVHGTFKLKSGTGGSHARDHKMHQEILESAQYPEITFAPNQIQGQVPPQGDFKVQVTGTFTLHGASHPLTLAIQARRVGEQLTADTTFTVPYANWGLKNPSTLFLRVNDTVDIEIHAVGRIKLPATP
jgi:hypothetical protein